MQDLVRRYWFLSALAAAVLAGTAFPEGGQALRASATGLPLLTAAALFASGTSIEIAHVKDAVRDVRALLLGLGSTYVAAPVLATGLVVILGPTSEGPGSEGHFFHEAALIAAAQAGTIASAPALTLLARGNMALALLLTVTSNVVTVVATPFVLRLALGTTVAFPLGAMMSRMTLVVLLPVLAGLVMRHFLWTPGTRGATALRFGGQSIILIFVYTGVSAAASAATGEAVPWLRLLVVAAALHGLLLVFVYGAATALGLDGRSRTALLFCGTQKTLPNGIYLWGRFFPENPYGALAMVQYHVFQLVLDTLLVPWLTPRDGDERRSG